MMLLPTARVNMPAGVGVAVSVTGSGLCVDDGYSPPSPPTACTTLECVPYNALFDCTPAGWPGTCTCSLGDDPFNSTGVTLVSCVESSPGAAAATTFK